MTTPPPPWCLHWGSDGELVWSDRYDVIQRLLVHEPAMAAALPKQPKALPMSVTCQRRKRTPSCSHP